MNSPAAQRAFQQALTHFQNGRLEEAARFCAQAIAAAPAASTPHHLLGVIRTQQGRYEEAAALLRRALDAEPEDFEIWRILGIALFSAGRPDDALASFDRAIALRSDFAPALSNRGDALRKLGRHIEAIASYERALDLAPADADTLFNHALCLNALGRFDAAADAYAKLLALRPDHVEALFNRGNALRRADRPAEALASYDRALAIKPDYSDALFNRGLALFLLGRYADAVDAYDLFLRARPDNADAFNNRGNALRWLGRYDEALASYDRALALAPDHDHAFPGMAHLRRMVCDWKGIAAREAALIGRALGNGAAGDPFPLLAVTDDSAVLRQAGQRYWGLHRTGIAPMAPPPYAHSKIRLGYLSGDFRLHAIAVQTAQMFELHDRARFEVHAFSYGPADSSEMRRRLVAAFDSFDELRGRGTLDIARRIRDRQIDVLVDISGYVTDGRPEILACRPAPVQVHYFGYPGPMGTDAIDYMLVDPFVVPADQQRFYGEKLVYLPDCYMVSDRKRRIADQVPSRTDCGLPERGFVFCSFNNSYKITPPVFDVWMRLLLAVNGSVLWLLGDNNWAEDNLRREAASRGVDPQRLVFAGRRPPAEHLARHAHADLFLDTLPYNAHVTASDALWTGLPIVTCAGRSFAARVAGSLLRSIGLPELVTQSLPDYEALALALATEPDRLARLRARLKAHIAAAPLFDSARITRQIEAAYIRMVERHRTGRAPESFDVGESAS